MSGRSTVRMGIRRALRLVEDSTAVGRGLNIAAATAHNVQIASPWSEGELSTFVWSDILKDAPELPLTRAAAIAVPAIARARHLIVSTIARMPLVQFRAETRSPSQPTWLQRTDSILSPQHRIAWTVDDLLFYGSSLWRVTRDSAGLVLTADRIGWDAWRLDETTGKVLVHEQPVPDGSVILIPGLHEGICSFAQTTIRAAMKMQNAAAVAADNPVPSLELHQTEGEPLTEPEIKAAIDTWIRARREHGVGYTSPSVEVRPHGQHPEQLLIEGRNAAAVDCARVVGIPAAMLDATTAGASLTYETTEGRNSEFVDYGLALYTTPITARLSLDDVVARGHRVALDSSQITDPALLSTGTPTED